MAEPQTESAVVVVDEPSASTDTAPVEELLVEEISIDGMCGVYLIDTATSLLDVPLELDPRVALRPEPFGALAYHYGNRRLVFLKHPDVVAVVRALGEHPSLGHALAACGVAENRWPSFEAAIRSLMSSEVVRDR